MNPLNINLTDEQVSRLDADLEKITYERRGVGFLELVKIAEGIKIEEIKKTYEYKVVRYSGGAVAIFGDFIPVEHWAMLSKGEEQRLGKADGDLLVSGELAQRLGAISVFGSKSQLDELSYQLNWVDGINNGRRKMKEEERKAQEETIRSLLVESRNE